MDITIHIDVDKETELKLAKLETALTLANNSREWNRRRVVELEDELARATRDSASSTVIDPAFEPVVARSQIRDLEDRIAQAEAMLKVSQNQAREYGIDRRTERERAQAALERAECAEALVAELTAAQVSDHEEIVALRARRDGYDADRHTEKQRAEANKEWAERAENRIVKIEENHAKQIRVRENMVTQITAERDAAQAKIVEMTKDHTRQIEARNNLLATATEDRNRLEMAVGMVSAVLNQPEIAEALRTFAVPDYAAEMQRAIRKVKQLVNEVGGALPTPPAN